MIHAMPLAKTRMNFHAYMIDMDETSAPMASLWLLASTIYPENVIFPAFRTLEFAFHDTPY